MTDLAERRQPIWLNWFLTLLPPFYPLSLLAIGGLVFWKNLPTTLRLLLSVYAASQIIPSLFTSQPLLSLLGATIRTALMVGLIGLGSRLDCTKFPLWLGAGVSIVMLSAALYSQIAGLDIWTERLQHPYMTSNTVGVAAAFGLWISLFMPRLVTSARSTILWYWLWRGALATLAMATLLASGSRGALLMSGVGTLSALLIGRSRRQFWGAVLLMILLSLGLFYAQRLGIGAADRLLVFATSGREVLWTTVQEVIQRFPLFGVGTYRLGHYLELPQTCMMWASACPDWASQVTERIGKPWLIAHNAALQQVAETGSVGLAGLMLLLGSVLWSALQTRQSLIIAVLVGLTFGNITDNLSLVPSPFMGEIFWMVAGWALMHGLPSQHFPKTGPALSAVIVGTGLLSLPLYTVRSVSSRTGADLKLAFVNAPPEFDPNASYQATIQFSGLPGTYQLALVACSQTCIPATSLTTTINTNDKQTGFVDFKTPPLPAGTQQIRLRIYQPAHGFGTARLAGEYRINVHQKMNLPIQEHK